MKSCRQRIWREMSRYVRKWNVLNHLMIFSCGLTGCEQEYDAENSMQLLPESDSDASEGGGGDDEEDHESERLVR